MFSSPGSVLAMRDLAQPRRHQLLHAELRDVAAELVEPLDAPRAHQPGQAPPRNAVALLQHAAHALGIEQAERAFEHRADLVAGLQHIDRLDFHQRLQPLGQRRLAAADRAEQIEDLLALFEALRGVAEEADDPLDRLFHAVEFGERRIDPDRPVHEDAAEPRILAVSTISGSPIAASSRSVALAYIIGSSRQASRYPPATSPLRGVASKLRA